MLYNPVLRQAVFSTAVHHGVGGANRLVRRAGLGQTSQDDFLQRLYEERDKATKGRFHNRFENESQDAIAALLQENNALLKKH